MSIFRAQDPVLGPFKGGTVRGEYDIPGTGQGIWSLHLLALVLGTELLTKSRLAPSDGSPSQGVPESSQEQGSRFCSLSGKATGRELSLKIRGGGRTETHHRCSQDKAYVAARFLGRQTPFW